LDALLAFFFQRESLKDCKNLWSMLIETTKKAEVFPLLKVQSNGVLLNSCPDYFGKID